MTNEPTPETDAKLDSDLARTLIHTVVCQRNAARVERDEHIARNNDALLRLHVTTAERDQARADLTEITAENERLATGNHSMEKEIPELRHALEKARAALEGIVEYGKLCNPGTATDCARLIYLANQALTTPAQ